MGSQPGGGHETPVIDWIAVYVMLFGACGLGVAWPLKSWLIAIIGGAVFLIGTGIALGYGIMNHTEDYEVGIKDEDAAEAAPAAPLRRITSA